MCVSADDFFLDQSPAAVHELNHIAFVFESRIDQLVPHLLETM
jgi:hypothetical protein